MKVIQGLTTVVLIFDQRVSVQQVCSFEAEVTEILYDIRSKPIPLFSKYFFSQGNNSIAIVQNAYLVFSLMLIIDESVNHRKLPELTTF